MYKIGYLAFKFDAIFSKTKRNESPTVWPKCLIVDPRHILGGGEKYLVKEDLATGEGDVEKKVGIGKEFLFGVGPRRISHWSQFENSTNRDD